MRVDILRPEMTDAFVGLLAIYREAIPLSERKTDEMLCGMLRQADYEFHVARKEGSVLGFSIVKSFADGDACLLEYMAVDRRARGRGIGGMLFRAASGSVATASRYVLLEVDSDALPVPDRAIRTRRKSFYRALGCREIAGLTYLMPSVTEQHPPDMNLLVYRASLPTDIKKTLLREWLQRMYVEVYGQPIDDGRIDLMLSDLPDRIPLA